jgi:hypothetical protein
VSGGATPQFTESENATAHPHRTGPRATSSFRGWQCIARPRHELRHRGATCFGVHHDASMTVFDGQDFA